MRPHTLKVRAFGPFRDTVEVDLDALAGAGLFLLHGETGAGKTTLLDALGFALFGQVPGPRGQAKRLRSDHARPDVATEVQLEVTLGGRRLRITRAPEWRRPKLRGTGTTVKPASVRLDERTGSEWRTISTRVGEADAEISLLIGMSADQFFQVVLLPQGDFARFLRADAEERRALLERLFGTDRFHRVEQWLAARRVSSAGEVVAAQTDVSTMAARIAQASATPVPQDVELNWAVDLTDQARARAESARIDALRCRSELDQAQAAAEDARRISERQQRRAAALADSTRLADAAVAIAAVTLELDTADRAADIAAELDAATASAAEVEETNMVAARTLLSVATDAGSDEITVRLAAARRRIAALETLAPVAQRQADEQSASSTAQAAADGWAVRLLAVETELAELPRERSRIVTQRATAQAAAARLPQTSVLVNTLEAAVAAARDVATLDAREPTLRTQADAARRRATALGIAAQAVRDSRLDGMRGELAQSLVDGDPCAVCGSLEHPDPYLSAGVTVTKAAEQEAFAAARAAEQKAVELDSALTALRRDREIRRAGLSCPDPAGELDAVQDELTELEHQVDRLAGLDADLARIDQRRAELLSAQGSVAAQQGAELVRAAEAEARAADLAAALRLGLGEHPDLESARSAEVDLVARLELAAAALRDQERATAAAGLASRAADAAARAAGFEAGGVADLAGAQAARRSSTWRTSTRRRVHEHAAAQAQVAATLADPQLVDLDGQPPVDLAGASERARATAASYDQAHARRVILEQQADDLADLVPEFASALDRLSPLQAIAATTRGLADLVGGLGANDRRMTLSAYVLAARLEEVAGVASQRLSRMTAGRYELVHTDQARGARRSGLGLLVRDAWTGQDRDTATLSGGETFLASLALALGLADVVAAEAGGARIDALFVDEGFGTLDEETLDEVMDVLDGLREGGRLVGVVSHVAELRQRIPAQLLVRKDRTGSEVTALGVA